MEILQYIWAKYANTWAYFEGQKQIYTRKKTSEMTSLSKIIHTCQMKSPGSFKEKVQASSGPTEMNSLT